MLLASQEAAAVLVVLVMEAAPTAAKLWQLSLGKTSKAEMTILLKI